MFEEWGHYGGWLRKKERKRKGIQESRFLNWSHKWLKWKVVDRGGSNFHLPSLGQSHS
jgi:hypothetical protein